MRQRFDSDEALLARCDAGEVEAYQRLYERYRAGAYAQALRALGDEALAAEAFKEAVLKVFGTVPGSRPRASLGEILHRSLRGSCQERARGLGEPEEGTGKGKGRGKGEEATDSWKALPAAYREALGLRLDTELSWGEIAGVLGVPEGTVRSRVHLALEQLSGAAGHGL